MRQDPVAPSASAPPCLPSSHPRFSLYSPLSPRLDYNRFYTDKDVRERSVCEITSSQTLDGLNTPLPQGLYDPRLGCTGNDARGAPCATCSNGYMTCPGHFGHIELFVPVYHPLLFEKLLGILRLKCFHCHKLRAPKMILQIYKAKFQLLQMGQYQQAIELDNKLASAHANSEGGGGDGLMDGGGGGGYSSASSKKKRAEHSSIVLENILNDIFTQYENYYLENDDASKLSLSSYEAEYHRTLVSNLMSHCKGSKSCPNCGAHSPKIRQDSSNKFFQSPLSQTAKRANAAEGIIIKPALTRKGGDVNMSDIGGYDSDDSTERRRKLLDLDDDEEENDVSGGRDKYMHASEVQAQIQRTWETNPYICNVAFAMQGPAIYFMQCIPVPPNRFRPPMALGGMVVEHVQNQFLSKIILSNELIRTNFATNSEAAAYKQWIQLQTLVNCFMDNSKDPSAGAATDKQPGIRQLLERKEGIFRKHMMGKRVNYACRSVISPDPYVGTNEIGLPRYFAETLTYPKPVTDINIAEMKDLVERGPNQYPGARWVEYPNTRRGRVNLDKMNAHQREAQAAQLLAFTKKGGKPAIVGRQLRDGDMVLMNRQVCTIHCKKERERNG